jgi:hypothetical protein
MVNEVRYYFFQVYDGYILGGPNTMVATEIAHYLAKDERPLHVYFFGHPRMGYYSLSTIPYLAPDTIATDIADPLSEQPYFVSDREQRFIFLPERYQELDYVRLAFPHGLIREFRDEGDGVMFYAYELTDP